MSEAEPDRGGKNRLLPGFARQKLPAGGDQQ